MNIRKLKASVTSGKWESSYDEFGVFLLGTSRFEIGTIYRSEDARYIAHCCNNFMRVLEALKTLPRMWNEDHSELCVSALEINRLIAELEDVK